MRKSKMTNLARYLIPWTSEVSNIRMYTQNLHSSNSFLESDILWKVLTVLFSFHFGLPPPSKPLETQYGNK